MDNPNAFPSVCMGDPGHPASVPGMTLRDWMAGQALVGGMANADDYNFATPDQCAVMAYQIADAMLAARLPNGGQDR